MNLLIVDDEPLIRASLRFYLEQNQIPPECIYEADNCKSMLAILSTVSVQAAFVDIQMPGPDGLTAIEMSQRENPDVHFYVLTGYSEFKYAHRAVQLHIQDYLLKPVAAADIQAIIQKEQAYSQSRNVLEYQLYLRVLNQNLMENFSEPKMVSDVLVCYAGGMKQEEFRACIEQIRQQLLSRFHVEFIQCSFLCWHYFIFKSRPDKTRLMSVVSEAAKERDLRILFFVSGEHEHRTLQEIQTVSYELFFLPPGSILTEPVSDNRKQTKGRLLARLLYWKKEKDYDQFRLASKQLVSLLSQSGDTCLDAEYRYFAAFIQTAFHAEDVVIKKASDLSFLFSRFATENLQSQTGTAVGSMDGIQSYIESHSQEKITVQMLAQQFGYSANHISSAFSKQYGVTVIQYLNRVRLSNACKLLAETNLSMQEIAEFVGYSDGNYFARIFTQEYKCSPSVYRKNRMQKKQ